MQIADTQGAISTLESNHSAATVATAVKAEESVAKKAFKFALTVWLISRVALSLIGVGIMAVQPESSRQFIQESYPDVVLPQHDLYGYTVGVWNIYDVRHFTEIARNGYSGDLSWQTAYFPGYPILIKLASFPLMGDYLLSALLVANLFALLFFWFLYRLVDMDYGEQTARRAVVWAAIFPASFFLFMGYTESIVLAGMVGAIYYARNGKWWLAGILAGLAALAKQPSIFILIPLAYIFWQQFRANKEDKPFPRILQAAWLLLCPLAAFAYTAYRYLFINAPLQDLSDMGGAQKLAIPGYPLIEAIKVIKPDNPFLAYNLMDIFFIVLTVALTAGVVLKLRSIPYALFAIALALSNLSIYMYVYVNRPEVNSPRRLLIVFPIFIFLALITEKRKIYKPLAYASAGLYVVMAGLFTNWIFIS
ncbi:MAG: glycosyltransferase family 39 protein [Chloroflexia bacterium]